MKKATDSEFGTEIVPLSAVMPSAESYALDSANSAGIVTETALSAEPVNIEAENFHSIERTLGQIGSMKQGISLNAKYYEFTAIGETVRGVYLGKRNIHKRVDGEPRPIQAVSWIDEEKTVWINAGVALVNQFDFVQVGIAVEITYTESVKVEQGKVKIYDVRPLYL